MSELWVTAEDGWPLSVAVRPAVGLRRAVAVCAHAMMCDRRTLDRPAGRGLASILAEAGFETWLADLRGHGQSGPPAAPDVQILYDDIVLRDIPALIRAAEEAHPELPVVLVGHSLGAHGGLSALGVLPDLPVAALVSIAGNVWTRSLEPSPAWWAVKRATIEAWGAVTRYRGVFPARRLRVGTDDEAAAYVRQWVRAAREDRWVSADGQHDYLAGLGRVQVPVLSVTSTGDRWMCRPAAARAWLAQARRAPVTHRVVGELPGDPRGVDHMGLVIRTDMRPVFCEIAAWCLDAVRAAPPA